MVNYGNGLIYKLCCKDASITDEYIGSTTCRYRRKKEHKNECNNENRDGYNRYVYQYIRENGGFDNWDMIILEEYSCESRVQLEMKEREWIELRRPTLNKNIPSRESQEYQKKYYEENKGELKIHMKNYYEENKDEILQQMKQYREEHKEELNEYKKIKHICECGGEYTNSHKSRHMKSQRHLNFK